MAAKKEVDQTLIGQFDQSFLIHMIKDFFVILALVTVLEFGLKAALVYYEFQTNGKAKVEGVAEEIANDVRSIMLNEGGPTAARTIYPIFEKNWNDLGYSIGVEPNEVTIKSIEELFDFTPRGIPAPDMDDGTYKTAIVELKAETPCLTCHIHAEIGDALGTVIVRNYLATDFQKWLQDVWLSAGLAIGKILLHSVLLFLLLRSRMEPLLRLRAVVSRLARAYGDLNDRAEIRSSDEFGALARDLNLFLDRISRLVGELDVVLNKVVRLNNDMIDIQDQLRGDIDQLTHEIKELEYKASEGTKPSPLITKEWFEAAKGSILGLDDVLKETEKAGAGKDIVEGLRQLVSKAELQVSASESLYKDLSNLGADTEKFQSGLAEMVRLEERMNSVIETGTHLVSRLRPETVKLKRQLVATDNQ